MTQQPEMTVTSREAAQALRDNPYLLYFLEPKSPSDVAREAGAPANLVHHHVKRAAELGLLLETGREAGKVYYQLAARTFRHGRELLDVEATRSEDMKLLGEAFTKAYLRSDLIAGHLDPEYAIYGFGDPSSPAPGQPSFTPYPSEEARPAHFQTRTVRLSPARYSQVVQAVSKVLLEASADSKADSDACSFAFLAFDGALREGHHDSQTMDSFLALPDPWGLHS